jgi:hypothetical protein
MKRLALFLAFSLLSEPVHAASAWSTDLIEFYLARLDWAGALFKDQFAENPRLARAMGLSHDRNRLGTSASYYEAFFKPGSVEVHAGFCIDHFGDAIVRPAAIQASGFPVGRPHALVAVLDVPIEERGDEAKLRKAAQAALAGAEPVACAPEELSGGAICNTDRNNVKLFAFEANVFEDSRQQAYFTEFSRLVEDPVSGDPGGVPTLSGTITRSCVFDKRPVAGL